MTQHIISDLTLDFLSGVDRPAQAPALALLIKSLPIDKMDFSADERRHLASTGAAMPDGSFPIRNITDLSNAIHAWGRANEADRAAVARHIKARAAALGATGMLPTSGPLAEAMGHMTKRNDQETTVTTIPDDLAKSQARVTQLEGDVAAFQKSNARLTCLLALTPLEKSYFLKQAEVDQDVYVRQGVAACTARASDLIKQDPVIYKDLEGNEYRQSDDPRMVSTAKRADENQKEVALQKSQLAATSVETRAVSLFKSLSGSGSAKGALLRAAEGITDEAVRKEALEMLGKADAAAEFMLKQHAVSGTQEVEEGSALDKLDKLAKAAQAKDPEQFPTYHDAYAHIVGNTVEGQQLYEDYENGN